MSYEPRGKVKALIDAMSARPHVALAASQCATIMDVMQSSLPSHLASAINHHCIFPITIGQRRYYGITQGAQPLAEGGGTAAPRPTTATGWKPPQMACTRPGAGTQVPARSHDTVDGLPPGAPRIYPDEPREEALAKMAAAGAAREATAPAQPASAAADASIPEAAGAEPAEPALTIELDAPLDEQQQDEPEPLSWSIWDDGDVDLFGLVELENGGYRIQAKDVARLRLMLAWLPA